MYPEDQLEQITDAFVSDDVHICVGTQNRMHMPPDNGYIRIGTNSRVRMSLDNEYLCILMRRNK